MGTSCNTHEGNYKCLQHTVGKTSKDSILGYLIVAAVAARIILKEILNKYSVMVYTERMWLKTDLSFGVL
jgi:hypothetical protein